MPPPDPLALAHRTWHKVQDFIGGLKRRVSTAVTPITPSTPPRYYNLDPNLMTVTGFNTTLLPQPQWCRLADFCLCHGIKQHELEKVYHRFAYTIESTTRISGTLNRLERARKDAERRLQGEEEKEESVGQMGVNKKPYYNISLFSLRKEVAHTNLINVWDVMLYAINVMDLPELPDLPEKERQLFEPDFARFVMACYKLGALSDHEFIRYFIHVFLDKDDADHYRVLRSYRPEAPKILHEEFSRMVTTLHPDPHNTLLYMDDHIHFPPSDQGGMAADHLIRYMYIYPIIIWPALAAQRALRRRVFGERFWGRDVSEPRQDMREVMMALGLPCDYAEIFRSLQSTHQAMTYSIKNLVRWINFQGDEEAVFGPQEVDVKSLLTTLRNRYGYRDAEFLMKHSLLPEEMLQSVGIDPSLRPYGVPDDGFLHLMVTDKGYKIRLDKKRHLHFFYNTYSGESTWQVPRESRFFPTFLSETKRRLDQSEREIKVRLVYYDDPMYQRQRRSKSAKQRARVRKEVTNNKAATPRKRTREGTFINRLLSPSTFPTRLLSARAFTTHFMSTGMGRTTLKWPKWSAATLRSPGRATITDLPPTPRPYR